MMNNDEGLKYPPKTKEFYGKTYIRQSAFPSLKEWAEDFVKNHKNTLKVRLVDGGTLPSGRKVYYIYARSKARDKKR